MAKIGRGPQNSTHKITTAKMLKQREICESSLRRKFTKTYGLSPHKWQLKQRLGLAAQLLINTNLLTKQIAYECKFATPSHFIRCFKREFGCTPEQFREQCHDSALPIVDLGNLHSQQMDNQ